MFIKKSKILALTGAVNEEMYKTLFRTLDLAPSTIMLNTPGGDFYQALAMYDLIRCELPNVKIVATGQCMSAGMVILQAGKVRYSYENCQFMVHYGQEENHSRTWVKHNGKLTKLHADILTNRSNLSYRTITENWFERDVFLNAQEAFDYGLIDDYLGVE